MSVVIVQKRGGVVIQNGLQLHLDAANADSYSGSGSTWADLTDNGYDFTNVDMTFTGSAGDDQAHWAIGPSQGRMNAAEAYGETFPRQIGRQDTAFTIEAWFAPYGDLYNDGNVWTNGFAGAGNGFSFQWGYNTSGNRARVIGSPRPGGTILTPTDATFAGGVFQQFAIVGTCDGTTGYFYKNGQQNGTWSYNTSWTTGYSDDRMRIGQNAEGNVRFVDGTLYQALMLYNRELTAGEIAHNYNVLRRRWQNQSGDIGTFTASNYTSRGWGGGQGAEFVNTGQLFNSHWFRQIDTIKVDLASASSGGFNCHAEIWTNNAGSPGAQVGTDSGTVAFTSSGEKTLTFSTPVPVAQQTKYWIVLVDEDAGSGWVSMRDMIDYDNDLAAGVDATITDISAHSNSQPPTNEAWRIEINGS